MTTAIDQSPCREAAPRIPLGLLATLALLSAVAPFSTDLYLPGFPQMVADLRTSPTNVQLTLTACLLGLAIGPLVFGPLSDRIGRVRPLLAGAAICVLASLAAALAPTIEVLIAARFVQGFTGAAGMVIGRAIVSDLATGRAAARAFSLLMLVGGLAPVAAPLAGGFIVGPLGWRGGAGCRPGAIGRNAGGGVGRGARIAHRSASRTTARTEGRRRVTAARPDPPRLRRTAHRVQLLVRDDDGLHLGVALHLSEHDGALVGPVRRGVRHQRSGAAAEQRA